MNVELLKSPTFRSIHFIEEAGLPDLRAAVPEFVVREFSASRIKSEISLFERVAGAFEFPPYFGQNWDALEESLLDLEWLPAKGYVLLVRDGASFWRKHPRMAAQLMDIWLNAAEEWSRSNVPFHLVFAW